MAENWIYNNGSNVTETDVRGLRHAKAVEKRQIKDGYKWVRINARTKVLVPFKNGKPTEAGLKIIQKQKELFGI